jgi:uncharacterized protein (TIGR02466 family)
MQAEITALFSVPVYQALIESSFTKELEFLKSIELIQAKTNSVSKNVSLLDYAELNQCKQICQDHLDIYIKNTLDCKQQFYITNSWIARSKPGEKHHVHFHPNSIISGVLYLQAAKNCGDLILHHKSSLRNNFDFSYDLNSYNIFNSQTWRYSVTTGNILIFPSWVNHSVEENFSDQDRIILGFNTFVRGTFGEAEYSANLKI